MTGFFWLSTFQQHIKTIRLKVTQFNEYSPEDPRGNAAEGIFERELFRGKAEYFRFETEWAIFEIADISGKRKYSRGNAADMISNAEYFICDNA